MIIYRDAEPDDAATIGPLFERSFVETFGHLYSPADLRAFLDRFTDAAWRSELEDPDYRLRIAFAGDEAVGFAKLGSVTLPVEPAGPALELRQLYVLRQWHGKGIAQALTDWLIAEARRRGAEQLYLSVFSENARAKRFYRGYGFSYVGPYKFMVGEQAD
jgi:ribosomal protein S18 acetylase RimI-like enzyme